MDDLGSHQLEASGVARDRQKRQQKWLYYWHGLKLDSIRIVQVPKGSEKQSTESLKSSYYEGLLH
jgi:hypothetical protein